MTKRLCNPRCAGWPQRGLFIRRVLRLVRLRQRQSWNSVAGSAIEPMGDDAAEVPLTTLCGEAAWWAPLPSKAWPGGPACCAGRGHGGSRLSGRLPQHLPVSGLPAASADLKVFHAGTTLRNDQLVTSGGRVLCVVGMGDTVSGRGVGRPSQTSAGRDGFSGAISVIAPSPGNMRRSVLSIVLLFRRPALIAAVEGHLQFGSRASAADLPDHRLQASSRCDPTTPPAGVLREHGAHRDHGAQDASGGVVGSHQLDA